MLERMVDGEYHGSLLEHIPTGIIIQGRCEEAFHSE